MRRVATLCFAVLSLGALAAVAHAQGTPEAAPGAMPEASPAVSGAATATPTAGATATPAPTSAPAASATATPEASPEATPAATTASAEPTPPSEEDRTQAPIAPPTAAAAFAGYGSSVGGNGDRLRELLGEPDAAGWAARFTSPFASKSVKGITVGELRSSQAGYLRHSDRFTDGGRLDIRMRRDRFVLGSRARVAAPVFGTLPASDTSLGRWHDRVQASYRRPFKGTLREGRLDARYEGEGGTAGDLAGGRDAETVYVTNLFDTPSTRSFDRRSVIAAATANGLAGGVRFGVTASFRNDELRRGFDAVDIAGGGAGATQLRTAETRQTWALQVEGSGAPEPGLRIGGIARSEWMQGHPRTDRSLQAPFAPVRTFSSENVDLSAQRHRAALGALWLPGPRASVGVRLEGETARLRGANLEDRNLATFQIADGTSHSTPWNTRAHVEGTYALTRTFELEASGNALASDGDDRIQRALLLSDRQTVATLFVRDVNRPREDLDGELRASARVGSRARVWVGERIESDRRHDDVVVEQPVRVPEDRRRDRNTSFAGARLRMGRANLDGKISMFHERIDTAGANPVRDGFDARAHAGYSIASASVWATAAWTDDRLDLPALPTTIDTSGFAPVDFHTRSLVGGGGVTWSTRALLLSFSATEATASADLGSRLLDLSADAAIPLGKRYVLTARARRLELTDTRARFYDGTAVSGMLTLGASF